jgi:hypothetical protein
MINILDLNELPKSVRGIVPVSDAEFIYQYVLTNPNVTAFGKKLLLI